MQDEFGKISLYLVSLFSILGIWQSGWEQKLSSGVEKGLREIAVLEGELPAYRGEDRIEQAKSNYEKTKELTSLGESVATAHFLAAKASRLVFEQANFTSQNKTKETGYLCNSREHIDRALELSPHRGPYYVFKGELETTITKVNASCGEDIESGRYLKTALEIGPFDTTSLFHAATAAIDLGDRKLALDLFRRVQEVDPFFTDEQREFVYQLVTTKEELKLALPALYPGVVFWINYFSKNRLADYTSWKDVFKETLATAISNLDERFRQGKVNGEHFSQFIRNVSLLPLVNEADNIRRRVDRILTIFYQMDGHLRYAEFLQARTHLSRVPVLKSEISKDYSPESQMLSGWFPDSSLKKTSFDVLGRSIGVFFPNDWSKDFLVLQNSPGNRIDKDLQFELYASSDNTHYHRYVPTRKPENFLANGTGHVIFYLNDFPFRYLKINYTGSNQEAKVVNALADLIEVYGGAPNKEIK